MYVFTCFHFSVQGSWSIKNQTLNLQELIWFVSAYYCKAKPTPALLQFRVNECPLQFCRVPREKWLSPCNKRCIVNLRESGLCEDTSDDPLYNEIIMDIFVYNEANLEWILGLLGLGPEMFKNLFSSTSIKNDAQQSTDHQTDLT